MCEIMNHLFLENVFFSLKKKKTKNNDLTGYCSSFLWSGVTPFILFYFEFVK